jgi:hypothetical protein
MRNRYTPNGDVTVTAHQFEVLHPALAVDGSRISQWATDRLPILPGLLFRPRLFRLPDFLTACLSGCKYRGVLFVTVKSKLNGGFTRERIGEAFQHR